jgi:hypothetical protein
MVLLVSNESKPLRGCRLPPADRGEERKQAEHPAYSRAVRDQTQEPQAEGVVERARAYVQAGEEWKARDLLVGHVAGDYDQEALELLGDVSYAMRDLPSAGAAWFGTTRRGADVDAAVEAWRERHHDHFAQMWSSLPRSVRDVHGNKRVDALRRRAEQAKSSEPAPEQGGTVHSNSSGRGVDTATIIAVALGILFVACAVVGFVTVVRWLVPGA